MKKTPHRIEDEQEPMGLVMSGWPRSEPTPRVHAYVWGPAPELAPELEALAEVRAA